MTYYDYCTLKPPFKCGPHTFELCDGCSHVRALEFQTQAQQIVIDRLKGDVEMVRSLLRRSEQEEAALVSERDKANLQYDELRDLLEWAVENGGVCAPGDCAKHCEDNCKKILAILREPQKRVEGGQKCECIDGGFIELCRTCGKPCA